MLKNKYKFCLLTLALWQNSGFAVEPELSTHTSVIDESASSTEKSWWDSFKQNISATWHSDQYSLYIPVNTWHNRLTYDREHLDTYNERPWGIGFGKYYDDPISGDRHSLYIMEFQDSHNIIEPIAGYVYQTYWHLSEHARVSLGYSLLVTARDDYHWIPIPGVLPVFSFAYKDFAIENSYVPGFTSNSGNVLFTWVTWSF